MKIERKKVRLTYGHSGLLGVSSDHLDGHSWADERAHSLFDPWPGRIDDAHQAQERQVAHFRTRRKSQNCTGKQDRRLHCCYFSDPEGEKKVGLYLESGMTPTPLYLWGLRIPCNSSAAGRAPSAGGWEVVLHLCCGSSYRIGWPARKPPSCNTHLAGPEVTHHQGQKTPWHIHHTEPRRTTLLQIKWLFAVSMLRRRDSECGKE